jgi:hypothetical protein
VRNAWDLARQSGPGPREQLPVPNGGRLRIDGLDVLDRPTARPTIVQLLDQDGALSWTQVLEPGDRVSHVYPVANSDDALARYRDAVIIERPRKPVELPGAGRRVRSRARSGPGRPRSRPARTS